MQAFAVGALPAYIVRTAITEAFEPSAGSVVVENKSTVRFGSRSNVKFLADLTWAPREADLENSLPNAAAPKGTAA